MQCPGVLIKSYSSLHLSAGGFCRADPSFRGRARYDNVSFFEVDGAVPVYNSAVCGRLVLLFSVCGLRVGQVFGPDVSVDTQFAIVQRYRDSVSPEHRRLARRYFQLQAQFSVVPIRLIHSSVHLIANPIDRQYFYFQKSRLYSKGGPTAI